MNKNTIYLTLTIGAIFLFIISKLGENDSSKLSSDGVDENTITEVTEKEQLYGTWTDNTPYASSVIEVYLQDDSSYKMIRTYKDGSSKELIGSASNNGIKFIQSDREYILINPNKELTFFDELGVIKTLKIE